MNEVKARVHRRAEGVGTYVDVTVILQQHVSQGDELHRRVEWEVRQKEPWIFVLPVSKIEILEIRWQDTVVFADAPRTYPVAL